MSDKIRESLVGMLAIADESTGVSGYHLSGNVAEWGEFPEVEAARAALAQQPAPAAPVAQEPDGWKLMPIEPTPEMLAATSWPKCAGADYAKMISAAPAAPVARFIPDLPEQMARDLTRFNETCEDGQEYDIPKERMLAMASFGLVRWCGGSRFEITDCGIAALGAMAVPPAAEHPIGDSASPVAEQPDTAKMRDLLKRYFDALDRFDREGPVSLVVAAAKEADALEKELRALLAGGAE